MDGQAVLRPKVKLKWDLDVGKHNLSYNKYWYRKAKCTDFVWGVSFGNIYDQTFGELTYVTFHTEIYNK